MNLLNNKYNPYIYYYIYLKLYEEYYMNFLTNLSLVPHISYQKYILFHLFVIQHL